jgi:hypothetical protein
MTPITHMICTDYKGNTMATKIEESYLRQQVNMGKTQKQIATELECSQSNVWTYCRKYNIEMPSRPSPSRVDLTGRIVGNLEVIKYEYTIKKTTYWLCQCKCGSMKVVNGIHLRSEAISSCGCARNVPSPKRTGFMEIPGCYFRSLQLKASKRGIEFDVTLEELWDLYITQERKCALSGEPIDFPLTQARHYRTLQTASVDRIDSDGGYNKSNIQWVHKHINLMKQDLLNEEFKQWCFKVASNTMSI